jgi:hypothetical protein
MMHTSVGHNNSHIVRITTVAGILKAWFASLAVTCRFKLSVNAARITVQPTLRLGIPHEADQYAFYAKRDCIAIFFLAEHDFACDR